eukprot:Protomagalhaensia_wolfi_Nauph_80__1596@NODE_1986_length_1255_cov_65_342105_g1554_i0_p1_GENE_NODE_1986_length_1255_cov_65_342105_g1554_i0NODE_1986_length_1255_cov_65_342105_g1554_i0_p1_ORF_typecomplete_len347_score91_92EIF_2_alpha/PF07541_12/2_1e27S1/PF00575_23/6_8e11S1/PF00575_23/8_9e03SDA1/PF05285_12/3_6e03SDA1/PF05285_12/0_00085Astro_capsid_p/PF12226_8/0_095RNA_pol_3_Rpc31/PF11705_8/0_16DNA_pol_phi/PF04931_13/0_2Sigma70_ner/PF04546_13/13Sigma70_ner/PF04546_13/19SURF2/PF05477_11/4_4e03SURF2/PF0
MSSEPRFYANEFPEPNDLVVVKVARIENSMGAYVTLLEYGNMEGLILPSELSKRRYRSISKLLRVGRQEVVMVVRVDSDKGYVDLSKKRVAPEDIAATEERYSKSKKVHLTTRQVANHLNMEVEELHKLAIWPLYAKYGHAYEGLREAVDDPIKAFEGINCPQNVIDALVSDMRNRAQPESVRIRARIHVSCSGEQGVVAIRDALVAGQKTYECGEESKVELKVQLVASPLYVVIAQGADKVTGLKIVTNALEAIKAHIESIRGGEYQQQGEIMVFGLDEDLDKEEGAASEESDSDSDEDDESDEEEDDDEEEDGDLSEDSEDDDNEDAKKNRKA